MRAILSDGGFPGGALAVVRDGRLVYAQGYGTRDASGTAYTPTTMSRIASLSKPLTLSRLRQMIAAGQLSWDTKVFPLLGVIPADARANDITVAHLARHTSGISGDHFFEARQAAAAYQVASPPGVDAMVRWTAHYPLASAPGSTYRYNNTNYAVLSRVMERASGRSYLDLMREMAGCADVSRWRLGTSLARAGDETAYYDGATTTSVFDSAPGTVPWPYGGYHVESFMGAVSLASNVIDVARYGAALERCIPRPEDSPIPTLAGYSYGYDMRGSMPGQLTYWLRKWDGTHLTQLVAFFNERTLSAFDEAVPGRLWAAAAQVATWPAGDRFAEYP